MFKFISSSFSGSPEARVHRVRWCGRPRGPLRVYQVCKISKKNSFNFSKILFQIFQVCNSLSVLRLNAHRCVLLRVRHQGKKLYSGLFYLLNIFFIQVYLTILQLFRDFWGLRKIYRLKMSTYSSFPLFAFR